jgi:hypothetical protein
VAVCKINGLKLLVTACKNIAASAGASTAFCPDTAWFCTVPIGKIRTMRIKAAVTTAICITAFLKACVLAYALLEKGLICLIISNLLT